MSLRWFYVVSNGFSVRGKWKSASFQNNPGYASIVHRYPGFF